MTKENLPPPTEAQISARMQELRDHCSAWISCLEGEKPYPQLEKGRIVILSNLFPLPDSVHYRLIGLDYGCQIQVLEEMAKESLVEEAIFKSWGVSIGAEGKVIIVSGEKNYYGLEFDSTKGFPFQCVLPITSFQEIQP